MHLIEGMAIGGFAMGATVGYNYIRGEFMDEPIPRFEAALEEAYAAGTAWQEHSRFGYRFRSAFIYGGGRLYMWRRNRL